jgi:hypothetical protein
VFRPQEQPPRRGRARLIALPGCIQCKLEEMRGLKSLEEEQSSLMGLDAILCDFRVIGALSGSYEVVE